ncbi:MAG: hypothetical protein VXZ70_06310 [Pseudomonadota bacterium]|nr:hypothetical protein [Pseudomonadota bacterium]
MSTSAAGVDRQTLPEQHRFLYMPRMRGEIATVPDGALRLSTCLLHPVPVSFELRHKAY